MLTDAQARKALPGERDYKLADEKGLFLLVRPGGGKLWRYKYRIAGKEKLLSFGPYPEVKLSEARDLRDDARRLIRSGVDPSAERKRAARTARSDSANSFEAVARRWHDNSSGRWGEVHNSDILRSFERDVFPEIGGLALVEIDGIAILDLLERVQRRGSIETAHRLRQRIASVFAFAISKSLVAHNPAAGLTEALKPVVRSSHQPAVTDLAELRELLA